jgi:hypothetical protein
MTLSRKHYQAIADIIRTRGTSNENQVENIKSDLAEYFQEDNPRFDKERFWKACEEEHV